IRDHTRDRGLGDGETRQQNDRVMNDCLPAIPLQEGARVFASRQIDCDRREILRGKTEREEGKKGKKGRKGKERREKRKEKEEKREGAIRRR
ncbi:hypothetical protein J8748_26640, partial [Klebsiella pneumoniae]